MKRFILTLTGPDRLGLVSKISSFLFEKNGFILEQAQFGDVETGRFFMRCLFEPQGGSFDRSLFEREFAPQAYSLDLKWHLYGSEEKPRTLILVSKEAHCLNDLLCRMRHNGFPIDVFAIASNHADLKAISDWYEIPFHYLPIDPVNKPKQEEQIAHLAESADLVVLARYMQILSPALTRRLYGKAINIHHSFLPSFKGTKPYHQAFERGVKLIGATAHFVSDELDEGPIIDQEVIRVDHAHSVQELVLLGRDIEAFVLARAVKHLTERRVFLNERKTVILH
jgi:formyltetrahydrofolate deformylase